MNIAYVIGPYRSKTIYETRQNIISAEQLGAEIARAGIFPYIPHKNTAFFDGLAPDDLWLEGNIEIIRRGIADIAVVNYGWESSSGSRAEIEFCQKEGVKVIYRDDPSFQRLLEIWAT